MKTIKLISAIFLITLSTMSFATINEPTEETTSATISKSKITETIVSQIEFPEALAKNIDEGFVAVSISFDSTGRVQIEEANASNPSLQKYVTTQLERITIANPSKTHIPHMNFKFNFRKNQ
jgi:hypothetical protein